MKNETDKTNNAELEELVLKESIVSIAGLNSDNLQIGIRGDPSLRETSMARKRYHSGIDKVFDQIEPNLEDLLINRSTYRLYVGFNSGEIRTISIFDPLREETHAGEKLADPAYVDRQFPKIEYEEKIKLMRELYTSLRASSIYNRIPEYWKNIMAKRSAAWQPLAREEIPGIISTFKVLREMPDYYLRNVTVCTVQNLIRMQFNCDGTQLVRAENLKNFLAENL
jgi:hypothetical protein